jgi:hypothetical protein
VFQPKGTRFSVRIFLIAEPTASSVALQQRCHPLYVGQSGDKSALYNIDCSRSWYARVFRLYEGLPLKPNTLYKSTFIQGFRHINMAFGRTGVPNVMGRPLSSDSPAATVNINIDPDFSRID